MDTLELFDVASEPLSRLLHRLGLKAGRLDGRCALVTGGARGIGRTTALALGQLGASVGVVDFRDSGAQTVEEIQEAGGKACFVKLDISVPGAMRRACVAVMQALGEIDILLNNAVEFPVRSIVETDVGCWDRSLGTNLTAPFIAARQVLPSMLDRGRGVIVSMIAPAGLANAAAMSASKAGLRSLVASLAAEVGRDSGVDVIGFAPGLVATPLVAEVFPEYVARLGLTFPEYVEQMRPNPGYDGLQPVEHCAASLVHAIVNARANHGLVVDPYRPLADAGIISVSEETRIEAAETDAVENAQRLRDHVREVVAQNLALDRQVKARTEQLRRELAERESAERALRESEKNAKMLAAIVRSSRDAIVTSTADGMIASWNAAAKALLGYEASEVIGKPVAMLAPDDDALRQDSILGRTLAGEAIEPFETVRVAKDGRHVQVSISISPVLGKHGHPVMTAASIRDITERKLAERRERELIVANATADAAREKAVELERAFASLAQTHEELKAAQEQLRQSAKMAAMGQLAGGIAHDFNNMLTAILTYASFVAEDLGGDHALRPDVDKIIAAANRTRGLTAQLLTFSRKGPMDPRVVDLVQVLHAMQDLLARTLGEDVEVEIETGHEAIPVCMDRGQLEQVILNLAVNARDAMPHGGRLSFRAESAEGVCVLTASDDGEGMTSEVAARVFEPFFTTKGVGKGTGMGLATVYGILEQAGGSVTVDSEPGGGTTFRVVLPRATGPATHDDDAPAAETPRGRGEKILLVEDERLVRGATVRVLEKAGYRVFAASGAAAALSLITADGPVFDLLLTDVVMPKKSGPELAEEVRAARPGVRVAYMSGYAQDANQAAGSDLQRFLLPKPFSDEGLLRFVRRVLEAERPESRPRLH